MWVLLQLNYYYSSVIYYNLSMQSHPTPRILNHNYNILDYHLLGKGSTGNVYLGLEKKKPHLQVAIKAIDLADINNQVTKYLLSCEIAALSNLGRLHNSGHKNVVKLHEIVIEGRHIYLVMEHLRGGTLSDYIKLHKEQGLRQSEALQLFRQILQGYSHIKSKKIVHRDLKPNNILFRNNPQKDLTLAIIDFGYCQMEEVPNKPHAYYNVGSPKYMAPQAYKSNRYSQKSDIWALGVILYELLVGKTCDQGYIMDEYLTLIENQGITIPNNISSHTQLLLKMMLKPKPQCRATCEEILICLNGSPHLIVQNGVELVTRSVLGDGRPQILGWIGENEGGKGDRIKQLMIVGEGKRVQIDNQNVIILKEHPQRQPIQQPNPLRQQILARISLPTTQSIIASQNSRHTNPNLNRNIYTQTKELIKPKHQLHLRQTANSTNSTHQRINFTFTPKTNSHHSIHYFQSRPKPAPFLVHSVQPCLTNSANLRPQKQKQQLLIRHSMPIEKERKMQCLMNVKQGLGDGVCLIGRQGVGKSIISLRPAFGVRQEQQLRVLSRRLNVLRAQRLIV